MQKQEAPRQTVQGVQVLLLKNGPYLEVAERVRSVHRAGKSLSFHRGEVLKIHGRWIYRAYITVDGQQYIGDAEIHFGAPPTTPDGTNPITCGQTSAVGNALAFAGFGTLKSVLARLELPLESEIASPTNEARARIQDIEVVMFDEQPYVDVAERIYFVHLAGKRFSMQQCKLIRYNDVWIYRAWVTVDDQPYIGDAEVYFDASAEPDRTYPISCGQTSAVGNALAYAGFGDVCSILERLGKDVPETLEGKPLLVSADAVSRALQRSQTMSQQGHPGEGAQGENGSPTRNAGARKSSGRTSEAITLQQRERIRVLCERLGEPEPDYAAMRYEDADLLLVQLELSEEELLLLTDTPEQQDIQESYMSREEVGVLKEAWLQAFRITGTIAEKRAKWAGFKRSTCQVEVDDTAMRKEHHDQLLAAIVAAEEKRRASADQTAKTPRANGRAH